MSASPQPGSSVMDQTSLPDDERKPLLEADTKPEDDSESVPKEPEPEEEPKMKFYCELCGMEEFCDYFGNAPPFANKIQFSEDCYVMRDPFAPPPDRAKSKPEYFLVLGSRCTVCDKAVCKDIECSFFYVQNFCIKCAKDTIKAFPLEVQTKLKKQLTSI